MGNLTPQQIAIGDQNSSTLDEMIADLREHARSQLEEHGGDPVEALACVAGSTCVVALTATGATPGLELDLMLAGMLARMLLVEAAAEAAPAAGREAL